MLGEHGESMKTMMKKLGIGCLAAIGLLAAPGQVMGACNTGCCSPCLLGGCWEIGGAALYQQTCVQNFSVADGVISNQATSGQIHRPYDIFPKAFWGFEVWLGWQDSCGCRFADVLYKRLHSRHNNKAFNLSGNETLGVNQLGYFSLGGFESLVAKRRTQFDTVRVRYGSPLGSCCQSRVYSFVAGRYVGAEIKRVSRATLIGQGVFGFREQTTFQGGGVEFGLEGKYCLGCGFDLVGLLGGMSLFGKRTDEFGVAQVPVLVSEEGAQAEFDIETAFQKRSFTKCVPGFETEVGIRYTCDFNFCGCCLCLAGEVGWQMDYFFNILALRPDNYSGSGFSWPNGQPTNFGTSGLYIALSACF